MQLPAYPILTDSNHEVYEFLSSGPKGTIRKVVNYAEITPGLYNLSFGDWDETAQCVRDNIRSNNADRDKVLATVASTIPDFLYYHTNATIFVLGETPAKTRLYQMGIKANLYRIGSLFEIEGFAEGEWETFAPGRNYIAFMVRANQNL